MTPNMATEVQLCLRSGQVPSNDRDIATIIHSTEPENYNHVYTIL